MGYMVSMDQNGDAEGNYTLIARKKRNASFGLHSVGGFLLPDNASQLPVMSSIKA
jgi:atrial natriuretic peptide receptor A